MVIRAFLLALLLPSLLAACATAPPLDATGARTGLQPYEIADEPVVDGDTVLWGGMIIEVRNLPDRTEIEVLAYPLDARQRPQLAQPGQGRFIAMLPGFVDPLVYPQGRFLTLRGRLAGATGGAASPTIARHPRVAVEATHLWPRGFRGSGTRIGVGIGIAL
jgi:outer membrane lipoprotein